MLSMTDNGRKLLQEYQKNTSFTVSQQNLLTRTICKYITDKSYIVTRELMEVLSLEIQNAFSSEKAVSI